MRLARGPLTVLLAGQRDALDRDRAVELLVVGTPDGPKPARAETLDQLVATEQQLGAERPGGFHRLRVRRSSALSLPCDRADPR
jgi:hypothetical protein